MKRIVLFSFLFGFLLSVAYAQDDMYFTPKKVDKSAESTQPEDKSAVVYYSSSSRDVDEYNRRGQYADNYSVMGTDTLISDVIVLDNDTAYSVNADSDTDAYYSYDPDEDYRYSRCMSRFDDFYWYNPWYYDWYWPYGWFGSDCWLVWQSLLGCRLIVRPLGIWLGRAVGRGISFLPVWRLLPPVVGA